MTALALTVATTGVVIRAFHRDNQTATGIPADWPVIDLPDLGLRFRTPPDWHLLTESWGGGELITNFDTAGQNPRPESGSDPRTHFNDFPSDGVSISIEHTSGVLFATGRFPVHADLPANLDAVPLLNPRDPGGIEYRIGFLDREQVYGVLVRIGPEASEQSRAAAADVVASIAANGASVVPQPEIADPVTATSRRTIQSGTLDPVPATFLPQVSAADAVTVALGQEHFLVDSAIIPTLGAFTGSANLAQAVLDHVPAWVIEGQTCAISDGSKVSPTPSYTAASGPTCYVENVAVVVDAQTGKVLRADVYPAGG